MIVGIQDFFLVDTESLWSSDSGSMNTVALKSQPHLTVESLNHLSSATCWVSPGFELMAARRSMSSMS